MTINIFVFLLYIFHLLSSLEVESCYFNFPTRLVDGAKETEGRVEIFLNFTWISICDMGWDRMDADVVCSSLGYGYAISVVSGGSFGSGSREVYPPLFGCTGDEENIGCCPILYNINEAQCVPGREAGVVCSGSNLTEGSLRFAGKDAKPYQGRLELYNGTEWGTICYNGWDTPDARVACRQMTFPGVAGRLVYTSGGGSSQPIWFDDVSCNGSETNLLQCRNNRNHNCHHNMDVGVLCSLLVYITPTEPPGITMRLAGGRTAMQGRVEVYRDNQWKLVCGSDWDQSEGDVVCRQLGLGFAVATINENTLVEFPTRSTSVWGASINCVGSEQNLVDCSVSQPVSFSCGLNNTVSVFCSGYNLTSGSLRFVSTYLIGSIGGRLETFINNEWGTVCNSGWNKTDAIVACRQLGFLSVDRDSGTQGFGGYYQRIWLKNVNCQGTESRLTDCPHSSGSDCDHFNDVAISCNNNVLYRLRLVGGRDDAEGYIQIFSGQWVPICNSDFDIEDATVACRQLGYNYSTAVVTDGRFPRDHVNPSGLSWSVSFDCLGWEQRLYDCPRRYAYGCTSQQEFVGVMCSQTEGNSGNGSAQPTQSSLNISAALIGGVVGGVLFLLLLFAISVGTIIMILCVCLPQRRTTARYYQFGRKSEVRMSGVAA
jgi:hypothetical protein